MVRVHGAEPKRAIEELPSTHLLTENSSSAFSLTFTTMEKIATYNLSECIHARNGLNEPLCGFDPKQAKLTDNIEEVDCPSCKKYKQFHRSQPI